MVNLIQTRVYKRKSLLTQALCISEGHALHPLTANGTNASSKRETVGRSIRHDHEQASSRRSRRAIIKLNLLDVMLRQVDAKISIQLEIIVRKILSVRGRTRTSILSVTKLVLPGGNNLVAVIVDW